MKTILSFIIVSLFISLSGQAQEMKYFDIKEGNTYVSFLPKMDTIPSDFRVQSFQSEKSRAYMSEVLQDVAKQCLSPELAQKIVRERASATVYFNANGEVFYLHFIFSKELKPFIREDDLLKLYRGYRAIRFDMTKIDTTPMDRVSRNPSDPFKYATWQFSLRKLAELVVPQPEPE